MSIELVSDDQIASFLDEGWITDVLSVVKSGKEATVYCCRAHPHHDGGCFALKAYKPLAHRSFRNDAIYQEGRFPHETREVRAMRTKTAKGRAFHFDAWVGQEFVMLQRLHAAGVAVPRPIAHGNGAILLEFIGEEDEAAPALTTLRFPVEQARLLLDQALRQIEIMLRANVVHGDLSAFNILHWRDRLVVIDVPQAIDPRKNTNARELLRRDVANVGRYFRRQGVAFEADAYAGRLWSHYQRSEL